MIFAKNIFQHINNIDKRLVKRYLAAISAFLLVLITVSVISINSSSVQRDLVAPADMSISSQPLIAPLAQSEFILVSETIQNQALNEPSLLNQTPDFSTNVRSGDNLSLIFNRAGLSPREVYKITNSGPDSAILSELRPGYLLSFFLNENDQLSRLELLKSPLESIVFTLQDNLNFNIESVFRTPTIEQQFKQANIQDSLFLAAQRGGISAPITMEIAGIFGGVIDFLLDTRTGDTFNVLYEEEYFDGNFIGNGAILATQFTNQGETFTAIRYKNEAGETGYYNPAGENMHKTFLLNPIDYIRISDGFNPARKHPILNTIRAHKGTDYAAPRGTPIIATSDGKVSWAARNGSFGKLVVIDHGERFQTKYAHLSDYARGIRNGTMVNQGQIIGYVGTTGSATGPHLHYEFLMDGVHRNSRTIHDRLPKAKSISEEEMSRFREQTANILSQLSTRSQPNNAAVAHFNSDY